MIITVPDFKEKVTLGLNGTRGVDGDHRYRTVRIVSGKAKHLDIMYTISYAKAYREGTGLMRIIAMIAKVLCPGSLITGRDYLKEDTSCILSINLKDIQENRIRLKYEIVVCDGGRFHQAIVKNRELNDLLNQLRLPVGFSITEEFITVDMRKRKIFSENGIVTLKDIYFKGRECVLVC